MVAGDDAGSGDGGSGNGSSGGGASEGGANGAGSPVEASDDGGCHAATRSNAPLEGFAGALALLGLAGLARLLTRGERARPSS